jgi:hypothetical protein
MEVLAMTTMYVRADSATKTRSLRNVTKGKSVESDESNDTHLHDASDNKAFLH